MRGGQAGRRNELSRGRIDGDMATRMQVGEEGPDNGQLCCDGRGPSVFHNQMISVRDDVCRDDLGWMKPETALK
jgi:hypothetical protein